MATNSSDDVVHLNEVIVAMVPFPEFSHLNQLFVLSHFIASHNIPVHFLCLAHWNQDLKLRVQGGLGASNIHFDDLLIPSSPTEKDDAGHDGMPPILMFLKKLREPFHKTCLELSTSAKRLVIIHDSIMKELIRDVHTFLNVKSYIFHTGSAFSKYSGLQQSIPDIVDDDHDKLVEQMHDEFPLLESCSGPYAAAFVRKEHEWQLNSGEIVNTLFIFLFSDLVPMATNSSDNVVHLNEVIVAMVPFPGYSHVNQLFLLSRLIASHNIPVHFLCFADRNQDMKLRVQGGLGASNIHFEDLLIPSSPIENDDAGRDGRPPIPMVLKELREPIHKTCLELSANAKRLVIIHDVIMSEHILDAHTFLNFKSYIFHNGATYSRYSGLKQTFPDIVDGDHDKLVEQMQDEFPLLEPHLKLYVRMENEHLKLHSGEIINSCKEVEGKYPDLLANAKDKPLWAFGPFHMLLESHDSISSSSSNMTSHECLKFLDKQDVNSVIFVSFGSTTTLSQEQVNELALGLERSNHRFIWVLRKGDDVEKLQEKDGKIELPEGFEERVEGRGMVVRNWAPQLEILGHSSTGGFLSHCGWNSCIESISMGVPLAAWPITSDQPFNAILVTNLLKIGISVKSWAHQEELVTASTIEKALNTLMGTTEGEEMRQRAVELSKQIKSSVSHGGPYSFFSIFLILLQWLPTHQTMLFSLMK